MEDSINRYSKYLYFFLYVVNEILFVKIIEPHKSIILL